MTVNGKVRDLIIDGYSVNEIATELEKSTRTVQRIIEKEGWKDLIKGRKANAKKLLEAGNKILDVSELTGLSESTVKRIKSKYKINIQKKKRKNAKRSSKNPMSSLWTKNILPYIKNKAEFIHNDCNFKISYDQIYGELIELMMEVDSLIGIENKDAYFKMTSTGRMKRFAKEYCEYYKENESIFYEDECGDYDIGDEKFGVEISPEDLLIFKECENVV